MEQKSPQKNKKMIPSKIYLPCYINDTAKQQHYHNSQ